MRGLQIAFYLLDAMTNAAQRQAQITVADILAKALAVFHGILSFAWYCHKC